MVFTPLLVTSSVSAASDFDEAIQLTEGLGVRSPNGSINYNATNSEDTDWYYKTAITRFSSCSSFIGDFNDTVVNGNGKVVVSQILNDPNYGGVSAGVAIWFTTTDDPEPMTFGGDTDFSVLFYPLYTKVFFYTVNNSGGIVGGCSNSSNSFSNFASTNVVPSPGSGQGAQLYYARYPITYPAGYEGIIPPESPNESVTFSPNIEIVSGDNVNFEARDVNYVTFDPVSFLCNDGLAPVIFWEMWEGWDPDTDVLYQSGAQSPTVPIHVLLQVNKQWNFVTWYSCAGAPNITGNFQVPFSTSESGTVAWQPALNLLSAAGFEAIIQDTHFNTFDEYPFLCESETTPVMYYELHNKSGSVSSLMTSGVMSPTVQFTYSLPKQAGKYEFVAWYSCGAGDLIFTNVSFLPFELNAYGGVVRECDASAAGIFCRLNEGFNFGIFSTTFQGINAVLNQMTSINPTYCSTAWIAQANFHDNIIGVQNFPPELCDFAQTMYLSPTAPYHVFTVWVNILLSGAAVLLLVFGVLSIFGIKVRLPSPLEDEADLGTSIRPDIKTSSSITGHKGTYLKSPSSMRSKDKRL